MTEHEKTKLLVEAGKVAREIIELARAECITTVATYRPDVFTRRLWMLIRDEAVKWCGLPRAAALGVDPMTDKQAERFREAVITYGKHKNHTVAEIEQADPEYLDYLADGDEFRKQLKRYLARSKFRDVE